MVPKNLRPLLPYLKKYRRGYVVGTLCVFLNNGIWILFPQIIRRAVDDLHLGVTRQKLLTYSLLLITVALTKGIFIRDHLRARAQSPDQRIVRVRSPSRGHNP